MAERATVFERPRVGVESIASPGTAVAADKVLQSLTITPQPQLVRNAVKANGNKAAVAVTTAKEHTDWQFEAPLTYTDAAYILASGFCKPTSTSPAAGVSEMVFRPKATDPDDLQTFTFEVGSSAGACRFAGAFVSDLTVAFSRNEAKISGSGMGRRYDEGITLTANPVDVPLIVADPDTVSIYVSDTLAGLSNANARLKRCVSANFSMQGRQTPIFTLDDSEMSFSASVERRETTYAAEIVCMQDSQADAIMARMRGKSVFWVRMEAVGATISGSNKFKFTLTFPCFVNATQRGDTDDIYAGTYSLTPVYNASAFGASTPGFIEARIVVPTAQATQVATANAALTSGQQTSLHENLYRANAQEAVVTP
jgi:hypothetical protein